MASLSVSIQTEGVANAALREQVIAYLTQEVPGCKSVEFSHGSIVVEADGNRNQQELKGLVTSLLYKEYGLVMPSLQYDEW